MLSLLPLDNPLNLELTRTQKLEEAPQDLLSREFTVLAGGAAQGLSQGFRESLGDLGKFASDFAGAPLDTSADYLSNHWHEAAIAGGIAVLSPRKYLNALLLLSSGRGLIFSTYEGARDALDPAQNINQVKERYAKSLSHETRSLLNALPATIAGGAAGRSFANTAFGKNMGALDLATGKVTMADVKSNLWKAHEQLFPPKAKLAVIDLDGTMVSTSKHLALAIEEGKAKISQNTGLSQETVSGLMNEQFGKLKSFVNPWTVELALAEKLNVGKPNSMTYAEFKTKVSDPYWQVFKNKLDKDLTVYDGWRPALEALAKEKIPAIILTNSPATGVLPRLEATGLHNGVSKVVMLENPKAPAGLAPELVKAGQDRLNAANISSGKLPTFELIPRTMAKPNPEFLAAELAKRQVRPRETMVLGDSLESDMALAQRTGARGFWTRWNEIDAKYDAMLNKATGGNFPPAKTSGVPFEKQLFKVESLVDHLRPARDLSGLARNFSMPAWYLPLQSYGIIDRAEK